jgi:pyruvate,water dikinase
LTAVPPLVLDIADPAATDPEVAGAKAANLARAAAAGFPVVPGIVLTTHGVRVGSGMAGVRSHIEAAVGRMGSGDLVVRSSSTIEDIGSSSMAGRFTSVLGVRADGGLHDAIDAVIASADRVRDPGGTRRPIAVLIQRQVEAALGGVLFGIDPVTGEHRHMVIDAVAGGPDRLVGGTTTADHYTVSRHGRFITATRTGHAPALTRWQRHELARMARRAERIFGAPQDIEWLIDPAGTVWFLQSRPVTAVNPGLDRHRRRDCVRLGPGPLAETFPDALRPLEVDLWVEPLRTGLTRSLRTVGAVSARRLDRSPIVAVIGGRVAVDLDLIGDMEGHGTFRRRHAPGRMLRRLVAAWRVGRLRGALPGLGDSVVKAIDDDLTGIPGLDRLGDDDLIALLDAAVVELGTAHTYELLAGMLLGRGEAGAATVTAAGQALDALVAGRSAGWDDATLIERVPIVLALTAPRLGPLQPLPDVTSSPHSVGELPLREALRLRVRWLQELAARVVAEVGNRVVSTGAIEVVEHVPHLTLEELIAVASGGPPPIDLAARAAIVPAPPLPVSFLLGPDSAVHPDLPTRHRSPRARGTGGVPAGGGRIEGTVVHDPAAAATASARGEVAVLVTEHLTPDLAPVLGHIAGLVAETGSALSHLAILARESGVATIAAFPDARRRLPIGSHVVVDGRSGEIAVLEPAR